MKILCPADNLPTGTLEIRDSENHPLKPLLGEYRRICTTAINSSTNQGLNGPAARFSHILPQSQGQGRAALPATKNQTFRWFTMPRPAEVADVQMLLDRQAHTQLGSVRSSPVFQ